MKIRKYMPEDIPQMVDIWNEVVNAGQAFPQEIPETLESGARFFASQSHCGVAVDAVTGKLLGLYILHPNNIGRCGHICNASYAVKSDVRGKGIGETLARDSLAMGAALGFGILQFNAVASDNAAANKLYKKLGFQFLGTIPAGFRRPDGSYVSINLYYHSLAPDDIPPAGLSNSFLREALPPA